MKRTRIIIGLLLCLTLVGCSSVDEDGDDVVERVKVGDHVPSFSVDIVVPSPEGKTPSVAENTLSPEGNVRRSTFSTDRLTGQTVIVLFNTGCSDCQRDLPLLDAYYRQHQGDAGFQMVAISREEPEASVAAFWKAKGLLIPYSAQEDRRIYNLFASSIIPRIYFVSPQGIVTRINVEQYKQ